MFYLTLVKLPNYNLPTFAYIEIESTYLYSLNYSSLKIDKRILSCPFSQVHHTLELAEPLFITL